MFRAHATIASGSPEYGDELIRAIGNRHRRVGHPRPPSPRLPRFLSNQLHQGSRARHETLPSSPSDVRRRGDLRVTRPVGTESRALLSGPMGLAERTEPDPPFRTGRST